MSDDFSKYTNQQLMQMISPETARSMSTAELMRVAGIPEDNFKYHNLEQEVIKNQPAPTLKKKKSTVRKHVEKIADDIGGLGETLGYAATTIGAMPLDIAQFGYGMAKSITQEDLSRENIRKNMSEETPASILRRHLVVQPRTERGQAMVKSIEEALGSLGNIAHDAIMKWGRLGGYDDKTSEQFAGVGSVVADLIPWIVGGKMVHAAKPATPPIRVSGVRWGIGENKSPSNFELGKTGDLLTPKRPANMPPAPVQKVRQPVLALPEPASATGERLQRNVTEKRLAERQAGMEEALAADDAYLAEEMAKGRENPIQYRLDNAPPDFQPPLMEVPSNTKGDPLLGLHEAALDAHSKGLDYDGFRKQVLDSEGMQIYHGGNVANLLTTLKQNGFTGLKDFYEQAPFKQERIDVGRELVEGLDKQKSGEFNHDAIAGDTVVTARDSLAVPATAKPVVKGTVAEVHSLIKDGTVNAKEHSTFYPEGMGNPDSPAYIIRKDGITKPLREVQLDLFNGKESEHLGYPERVGDGTDVTAAVTKQGEVLTDPNAIKLASADKEVAWASEGKADEVVSKAQEVGDSIKEDTLPSIKDKVLNRHLADEVDLDAVHFGDGGIGRDTTRKRMTMGRSTGHFGTGTYFLSSKYAPSSLFTGDKPVKNLVTKGLNLFKPRDPQALYNGLKVINNKARTDIPIDFDSYTNPFRKAAFDIALEIGFAKEGAIKEAIKKVVEEERAGLPDTEIRSASTRLMQELGYDGIDVRGTKFDNTDYGSVIYPKQEAPIADPAVADKQHFRVVERDTPLEETPDHWTTNSIEDANTIKDSTPISDMNIESDTQVLPKDEITINDERVSDLQQEQPVSNNGSGESAASLEAQRRLKSQERSRFYAISKGGKVTELPATVDRVDIPTPKGGAIYEVTELGARRVDGELSISQRKLDNLVDRYRSAETQRLTQEVEAQEQKLREQDNAGGKVYDLSEEMLSEETPESYIESAFTDTGDFSGATDIGGMIDDILRGNPEVEMSMGINPIKQSKALVDAIDKTWFERTSWATRNFFRSTRTTQFLAEKIPVLKDLYKMFGRRREYRYGIEYDLFKGGEDGIGVSKGIELYDSLSHQEKIDFDFLIYASDARNIFHDPTPRADGQPTSLETSNNVIGRPVSPKVAELYGIYKQVADKVVKALDEGRKDLALSFYEKSPYYNELKRILYDREFRDEFIEDPIESAKIEQEAIHNYLDESGLLYNEEFVKQLDKLSKDFGEIEATSEAYAMKAFYAHRARERGDLFLRVYPKINGEVKTNVPVFSRMVNSIADYRKLKKDIEKDPERHFPINFKDYKKSNPDVEWVVAEPMDNPQPSESVYLFSGSKPANIAKLQRALDNVKESGKMDEALRDELGNELVKEFSKITAARGFGRTGLAREANFIEGHNRENYWGQMIDFIEGMAGAISKARFTADALNLVKDAKPEHVPFLEELIRLNLENKNSPLDAVGATIRSAIAAIYLAFRPVSFVLNATQNLSMGLPELNSRLRGLGLKTNGDTALAQVWAEMLKNVITRSDFVGEDRAFLDWFSRKGADQAQFVNEIGGLRDRGVNRAFQKAVGYGLWAFGKVESVMNREALGLAAYRRLRENGMDVESARGLAKEISDVAHGDMSPENLPLLAQKGGMPVRTLLALRRFTIHQLNWLFNRVSQKEFAPVGRFLVTQAALGGVMATPLFMVINDVLERKYGKSPLLEIKKYIHDQLQDNPDAAQVVDDLVIKGIPAAVLGIDISRNIGVELPYMFEEGDNSLAEKLGGAYYTYGSNVGKGIERISNGQPLEGISKILPPGLGGDMMKAYLGYTRGMRDIQGRPLVDSNGKPIMYNAKEAIGQAGGFVPTRLNQARLLRTSELNISNYIKARADKLANRVRNAEADGDKEAARIHQKRFEEFLKKVEKEYPGLSRRTGRIKQSDISQTTKKNLSYEENLLHIKKPKVTEDINIDMSDIGGF